MNEIIRVSPKFQVTIPVKIREAIDLEIGDMISLQVNSDKTVLVSKDGVIKSNGNGFETHRKTYLDILENNFAIWTKITKEEL